MVSPTIATTALNPKQKMTDYKKYSLENLENWLHDAMSAGEATPQEIYDVIISVVKESHDYHKVQADQAGELLNLLNSGWTKDEVLKEREYYESPGTFTFSSCSSDDTSPECMTSWNDFWSDDTSTKFAYNTEDGDLYSGKSQVNKSSEPVKLDGYSVNGMSHSKYWYEYDRNDPNRPNPFGDRIVKWRLPVEVDSISGEYYFTLPDDLLEKTEWKEDDALHWVDNGDGSFTLQKVEESEVSES